MRSVEAAVAAFLEFLVFRIASLEECDLAVTLKSEDMRGDAVEEPPVVAYHHGTTGEILRDLPRELSAY